MVTIPGTRHFAHRFLPHAYVRGRASTTVHILLVIMLALSVRLAFLAISCADPVGRQMTEDSSGYLTLASNLIDGRGFARTHRIPPDTRRETWLPELARTPAYPALLALLQLTTGRARISMIVLQHLVAISVAVAATIVGRRLFGPAAGLCAGCLIAVDLQGAALGNLVLTETVFGALLFLAALATSRLLADPSPGVAVAAGLLMALSVLVKPTTIALTGFIAVVLVGRDLLRRELRSTVVAIALLVAGYAPVAAWIVRNGTTTGEYIFSSIPRYQLLAEHAAAARARRENVPVKTARAHVLSAAGLTNTRLRFEALSASEDARVRRVALQTIWENKFEFLLESASRSANMILGPDKDVLKVLGLPNVSFGIIRRVGPVAGVNEMRVYAWTMLGAQIVLTGIVYILVLRTIGDIVRRRQFATPVYICLSFAVYVLGLSIGSPGNPRYRWPVMALLVLAGVASLGRGYRLQPREG